MKQYSRSLESRVARRLALEARIDRALGDVDGAQASTDALLAVQFVRPARTHRSAPTGRFSNLVRTAIAIAAPIVSLVGLLLSGLALV